MSFLGGRYDNKFVLNMTSAAKIEQIVDKVTELSQEKLTEPLPPYWFNNILDPEVELNPKFLDAKNIGEDELAQPLPFLPFKVLLITGTAGAGKTSSIQTISANINCITSATTSIAAQNLSAVLNRSKYAQVKTIYKVFGFTSCHVSMCERQATVPTVINIETQQKYDFSIYWNIISDIANTALVTFNETKTKKEFPDLCESNVIVIDESGMAIRHILHTVVFFYWYYNGLYDTHLYRSGSIPCIVCVGSPTQTGALVTQFDPVTQNKEIRRGIDVLSALICDEILSDYCNINFNWVMFINNKRCIDFDFGKLLKHMEFGLPLDNDLIEYVDNFVRPASFIREPTNEIQTTRLFLSHNEVQTYFKLLHEQIAIKDQYRLFEFPVYCIVNNQEFERYKEHIGNLDLTVSKWFKLNLYRINTYSQFIDQDISSHISVDEKVLEDGVVEETIITCNVKHVRNSSIGVNAKMKCCFVGYSGTFDNFVELLQSDLFIERASCEQAIHAYSFLSGLLYAGMFSFCCSTHISIELMKELRAVNMPTIDFLQNQEGGIANDIETPVENSDETDEIYNFEAINALEDIEMLEEDLYTDSFFTKYNIPPTNTLSFEDVSLMYNVFKDIFINRYNIMQKNTNGEFGKSMLVTYNRNNVSRKKDGEIYSHMGNFSGMLSFAVPSNSYTLEGFTFNPVSSLIGEKMIPNNIYAKGLPRLVVKDSLGFISILENNIAKFVDYSSGEGFNLCSVIDYGIVSNVAMTITKSQGLTLHRVAIDFGNDPKNLKLSSIYVAMSRVVDPNNLIMNLNPLRYQYENDNIISHYIIRALKNRNTHLIF
ncbi:helicase primase subunit/complex protein [Murid herpesvirus 3]|uniref:Helicase primase subunit/complex protein n=2 Tax=Murid betaherpesvirus 3 TaxID=2560603 RepID=A0A1P8VIZ6_9BETA|nr:helicase primase subunit/complex protein [Murine roseolovirus]APZ76307.1 helicase primase subunit/complex protein [Murid betaherpesvirus 3]AYH64716.1 helicase primase subunit/complex protein [Murid herpesvirus 3]